MLNVYLEKRVPDLNQRRFYHICVIGGVFGDWAVLKEWGRIGSPGTVRSLWYATVEEALQSAEAMHQLKLKRGYALKMKGR